MKDVTLMKLVLTVPYLIDKLKLSKIQIELIRVVQAHPNGFTTAIMSQMYDTTTQSASSRLKALWLKGYLERSESEDGTGGILHVYKIIKELDDTEIIEQ